MLKPRLRASSDYACVYVYVCLCDIVFCWIAFDCAVVRLCVCVCDVLV